MILRRMSCLQQKILLLDLPQWSSFVNLKNKSSLWTDRAGRINQARTACILKTATGYPWSQIFCGLENRIEYRIMIKCHPVSLENTYSYGPDPSVAKASILFLEAIHSSLVYLVNMLVGLHMLHKQGGCAWLMEMLGSMDWSTGINSVWLFPLLSENCSYILPRKNMTTYFFVSTPSTSE